MWRDVWAFVDDAELFFTFSNSSFMYRKDNNEREKK